MALVIFEWSNCSTHHENTSNSVDIAVSVFMELIAYLDIILHFFAVVINMLSVFILVRAQFGGQKMNLLLILLGISETCYAAFKLVPELLEHAVFDWRRIYVSIMCRIVRHGFLTVRNWWIVVIAVTRFLVVSRPLLMRVASWYNRKALILIFLLTLSLGLAEAVGVTYLLQNKVERCLDSPGKSYVEVWTRHSSYEFFEVLEGGMIFSCSLLPVAVLCVICVLTLTTIRRTQCSSHNCQSEVHTLSAERNSRTVTKIVALLTLTFILFELPVSANVIFCFIPMTSVPHLHIIKVAVYEMTYLLVAMDSIFNFFIYFFSAAEFRYAFLTLLGVQEAAMTPEHRRMLKVQLRSLQTTTTTAYTSDQGSCQTYSRPASTCVDS